MWSDVSNLRSFYSSNLGQLTQELLCSEIKKLWPKVTGQRILTIGYGPPLSPLFNNNTEIIFHLMPQQQGVIHWPSRHYNSALLSDESRLPFNDSSLDRVVLLHAIEFTSRTHPMLREIWRTLAAGGKLLVVAPNRGGLWTRLERTPFGHGEPYSVQQLTTLLRQAVFLPEHINSALYIPPTNNRVIHRLAGTWEKVARNYFPFFSGVIIVEAEKRVYLPNTAGVAAKAKDSGWRTLPDTA